MTSRKSPVERRRELSKMNDEDYASEVTSPERKAVLNHGTAAAVAAGAATGGAGFFPVAGAMMKAKGSVERSQKRIELTKGLIDSQKAKNKELRSRRGK